MSTLLGLLPYMIMYDHFGHIAIPTLGEPPYSKLWNGAHQAKGYKEVKKGSYHILVRETEKISRNATCPCGSGNKYKNCCGGKK